jgi:hypothetical protein
MILNLNQITNQLREQVSRLNILLTLLNLEK